MCRRAGLIDEALRWYECAAEPAAACDAPVVLAIVARSLGQLSFELEHYADAEQYFDGLGALAERLDDPETRAYAVECKGASQRAQLGDAHG